MPAKGELIWPRYVQYEPVLDTRSSPNADVASVSVDTCHRSLVAVPSLLSVVRCGRLAATESSEHLSVLCNLVGV